MKKSANPADTVEHWDIERLIPYARNSRTHSEAQIAQIAASMKEWGVTSAVLVDEDGGIIAGHGRVLAARKLGKKQMSVMVAKGWTDAQKKAYVIADNQLALNAGWDKELLKLELDEIEGLGFDLDLIGFSPDEMLEMSDIEIGDATSEEKENKGNLSDRFMLPPFTVLNAREGWWQNRKRAWLALGIKSELGRGGGLTMQSEQTTSAGLNYYRDEKKQRQAEAPDQRVTTAKNNAATARERR